MSPPRLHTHIHTHTFSRSLTVCNNMKQCALQLLCFQIQHTVARLDLNPEHVAHELCHCVKALIRYARPTFFLRICA